MKTQVIFQTQSTLFRIVKFETLLLRQKLHGTQILDLKWAKQSMSLEKCRCSILETSQMMAPFLKEHIKLIDENFYGINSHSRTVW